MGQKVVTIRMSVSNNVTVNRIERDFIEHMELNKLLEAGWKIVDAFDAVSTSSSNETAYTSITFILEKE
jgi:hypothetical protein